VLSTSASSGLLRSTTPGRPQHTEHVSDRGDVLLGNEPQLQPAVPAQRLHLAQRGV